MAVFGFTTPPDCGEKLTLEITILMSLTFYMTMVSEMQPPSSETPILGNKDSTRINVDKQFVFSLRATVQNFVEEIVDRQMEFSCFDLPPLEN